MKQNNSLFIGKKIEELACIYLTNNNLYPLRKNFRTKFGEIDLICNDVTNNQVVFVEVKYKRSTSFGEAVYGVTKSKQIKLIKTAYYYLQKYYRDTPVSYRFDVVSCNGPLNKIKIDWIINAFILD